MPHSVSKPYALLSVFNKADLGILARALLGAGYRLLSTGGTAKVLRSSGFEVTEVSEVTGFPEMMDGRVKTLHPRVHGGLLARRDVLKDQAEIRSQQIADIRVAVVNLYPFGQAVAAGDSEVECLEQIDIGGPALIRAAAKNFSHVSVLVDPLDYPEFVESLVEGPSLAFRRRLAAKAFAHTAAYDAAIATWFDPGFRALPQVKVTDLRYGENPHQPAALWRGADEVAFQGWQLLQGKELSYNNLLDADAAAQMVAEFDEPACVIVKHTNPAGAARVGVEGTAAQAFELAYACDPVSAFGGVVAFNRPVQKAEAECLLPTFWEVVVAPEFTADALEVLATKRHLRLLEGRFEAPAETVRDTCFGRLVQGCDPVIHNLENLDDVRWVTQLQTPQWLASLGFVWKVCKHTKSNAIVLGRGLATVGVGAGQVSRVDAVRVACAKAGEVAGDAPLVLASDAFFPFRDAVDVAAAHGVRAIIQPGGSKRDDEVIAACNEHGMAMVFTGRRHFRH